MTTIIKKSLKQVYASLSVVEKVEIEVLVIIVILVLGSIVYHYIEGWRFLDAFYFSSTTLAAVGYGDFYPKTDIGKIFTVFYQFIGIPFFVYTTSLFINKREDEKGN